MSLRIAAACFAATLSALGSVARAQDVHPVAPLLHQRSIEALEADPALRYDPSTLLVRFTPGTDEASKEAIARLVGGGRLRRFMHVEGLELLHVRSTLGIEAAQTALVPHVRYAEPNWVLRSSRTPNDTYFNLQYGVHNTGQSIQGVVGTPDADVDGAEAWDLTTGEASYRIAVIDTGAQWSHPDLSANVWVNPGEVAGNGVDDDGNGYIDDVRGWDFYSRDNDPDDSDGHGTHTAGTIGAVGDNGIGVAGVNWSCKLVPLRFLGPQGGYTSDALLAVNYCTTNGIKVSNNSWGGGGFSQALYDAINASKAIGHIFVAAAGNDGRNNDSTPSYPGSYNLDNIISVAATDNRDGLASFSNYGASSVDVGAPGVNIASTYTGSNYVWLSGTSMASPHVAGIVALVYQRNPGWTYGQVVGRILATARPVASLAGRCVTGGVVNAYDALNTGGGGDITPPAAPTGLTATAGNATVALDWANNTESDLAGYTVLRSTTSGGGYAALASGLTVSAYTDNSVTNGTTYFYVVRAYDVTGNVSGNSSQASATPTGGGGPTTLFQDGFESGGYTVGGWTRTNSSAQVLSDAARTGAYGARVRRTSEFVKSLDTSGYATVTVSYDCRTSGLDSNEWLYVEYWNGSTWQLLEATRVTSWQARAWNVPGSASFRLRFRCNANQNPERGDYDNVLIVGS